MGSLYDIWASGMTCRAIRQAACAVALGLGLLVAPGVAAEDLTAPRTGLLWHKSGLPATFPLLVMTSPGHSYYLTLNDTVTGTNILAAFIVGGEFFQVLVPPGTYTLHFEQGVTWQGEDTLFGHGAGTDSFALGTPLTFKTRGFGIRGGHKVDLRSRAVEAQAAQVSPRSICQSVSLEFDASRVSPYERDNVPITGLPSPHDIWRILANTQYEAETPYLHFGLDPLRQPPRQTVYSQICD